MITTLFPELGCRIEYPGDKRDSTVEKQCKAFLNQEFREGHMTEAFCNKPLCFSNYHRGLSRVHVSFYPDYAPKHPEPALEWEKPDRPYRPWMNRLKYLETPCSKVIPQEVPIPLMSVLSAEGFEASTEQREPIERTQAMKTKLLYNDMLGRRTQAMKTRDQVAEGMSTYLHQQREKEDHKRATDHLRKKEEARVLHAAVAHHNPMEGLTGMAHVDALRGEL